MYKSLGEALITTACQISRVDIQCSTLLFLKLKLAGKTVADRARELCEVPCFWVERRLLSGLSYFEINRVKVVFWIE
jgi:hypothetical protein